MAYRRHAVSFGLFGLMFKALQRACRVMHKLTDSIRFYPQRLHLYRIRSIVAPRRLAISKAIPEATAALLAVGTDPKAVKVTAVGSLPPSDPATNGVPPKSATLRLDTAMFCPLVLTLVVTVFVIKSQQAGLVAVHSMLYVVVNGIQKILPGSSVWLLQAVVLSTGTLTFQLPLPFTVKKS